MALLLAITAISLGALTATVGVLVEGNAAAATGDAVGEGLTTVVAPGPAGVRRTTVPLGDGTLTTANRTIRIENETAELVRLNGSAVRWSGSSRGVVATGGAVASLRPGGARLVHEPVVAVDDRTVLLGLTAIRGDPVAIDGGRASSRVTLAANASVARRRFPTGNYSLAVETAAPAAWERVLTERNATVDRTDPDGDGVVTVVGRFPAERRLDLAVRTVRLEVTG